MQNIHFTREGRRFLIAVVLIGFAALNTGNNLIYLIFSMMLSISLISFIIALINLRGLKSCTIDFREPVYARTPFKVDIAIHNSKVFPSYSVAFVFQVGLHRQLYFPIVEKGKNRKSFDEVVINKRGRHFFEYFKLRTGFPFIFMYFHKDIFYGKELIVYPQIIDVSSFLLNLQQQVSYRETTKIGYGGDFLFSREYVYGEESRNIDWKATAKIQKTMVREFSRDDDRLATVILDNGVKAGEDAFEKAVSVAASLCSEFIEREYYVRLITCGKIVPFGNGRVHLFKMLDILAAVKETDVIGCPVGESLEGLSVLIMCSDICSFTQIAHLCTGVIDARYL